MSSFTASVTHNEETVNAFTRTQFNAFSRKKRNLMLAAAVLLLGFGAAEIAGKALSTVMILIGCLVLVDIGNIPKRTAKAILSSLKQEKRVDYEFGESRLLITENGKTAEREYSSIIRLIEDRNYCYLFSAPGTVYMLEKNTIRPDDEDAFKSDVSSKCGLKWTSARSPMTANLFSVLRNAGKLR